MRHRERDATRKTPVIAGIAVQLAAIVALLYVSDLGTQVSIALWFVFGVGAASHMLAFSSSGDIVKPQQIGTSAAIVNGTMFLVSGFLISRPGVIAAGAAAAGAAPTLEAAAAAGRPLVIGLVVALVLAAVMRETYPARGYE